MDELREEDLPVAYMETDYQFSDRFERRMKKLIRLEAHPWTGAFYRISKRAAILFLCVISSFFVITMSMQAYRTRFFETVKSIWEDSILYSYSVDQDQGDIQCKEPGFIPEGYQETERIVLAHWFSIIYTNEDGKTITWDQMLVQEGENWQPIWNMTGRSRNRSPAEVLLFRCTLMDLHMHIWKGGDMSIY